MTTKSAKRSCLRSCNVNKRNIAAGCFLLLHTRTTFTKSVMVSVGVSKLGWTHLILVDSGIKIIINAAYYRDVLLKQEMLPNILATSSFFSRTVDRSIGPVRRSRYYSERFRLLLLPICGLPTAPTSTLWLVDYTRCGVRCRTVFIGRRCKTLMIWNSVWLTWDSLEQSVIDDAIYQWRSRLRACVRAKGEHFEQSLKLAFEFCHKLTFCLSLLKLNVLF